MGTGTISSSGPNVNKQIYGLVSRFGGLTWVILAVAVFGQRRGAAAAVTGWPWVATGAPGSWLHVLGLP